MYNTQSTAAHHDNQGFQYDNEKPPPYYQVQGLHPAPPHGPLPPVNTRSTTTVAQPLRRKGGNSGVNFKYVFCGLALVLVAVVVGVLIWFFMFYQCTGRTCHNSSAYLSASQWCDGVKDCPEGEDESQCLRLHGTNFVLQSFSAASQTWRPVCAERWGDAHSRVSCKKMGYRSDEYLSSGRTSAGSLATGGYSTLKTESYVAGRLDFTDSKTCSANIVVTLRCIDCGVSVGPRSEPQSRIVGGTEAASGAWPWQVSLQYKYRHRCGGTIISREWILSAAHCFEGLSVLYGGVSLRDMVHTRTSVRYFIVHEDYNSETQDNDVALVRLSGPLVFSRNVRPACLPNVGLNLNPVRQAWTTGWGALQFEGPSPDKLMQAEVTIYSRETCNQQHILDQRVTETMICAGKLTGGVDSCQGDSGGPLVAQDGGVWWLAGDTSWGLGCAYRNKPGVYGNVTYFKDWVYKQMQTNL